MNPKPTEPFSDWPVQLYDSRFGFAWYTEPCALVTQSTRSHATLETVEALHDAIDHLVQRESAAIEKHGGLTAIHDWRLLGEYTSAARVAFLERMKQRKKRYLKQVVIVIPDRPLMKFAVQTASSVMSLFTGGQLLLTSDLRMSLARLTIARPTRVGWS